VTGLEQIDMAQLSERLKVARTAVGLTQEQAASALNMARTTMVAIERGDRQVRPNELIALAGLYKTTVHALLRPTALHVDLVGQFRRNAQRGSNESESVEVMRLLHRLATTSVELERRLGRPLATNYPPERPIGRGRLEQQAEDIAMEVRTRLGIGVGPIPDLVTLLELEMGMRIFVRPLPSNISGVFAYHEELGACILLNASHPKTRRAWTLAHELAHFMTRRQVPSISFIDESSKSIFEEFADLFASALLMQGGVVRRAFADLVGEHGRFTPRHLIVTAHRFHVSVEAMCRRLEQLELVEQGTYEALRDRGLRQDVIRQVIGDSADEERPGPTPRFIVMAVDAYSAGLLSESQLVDMLMLDRVQVRQLIDELSDESQDV
jgi:Zn-dependent peptidase ImmA (M78 family)/DNA-binding XRE family transcriptional regulator